MSLFLDTANTDCWADLGGTRLFSGITTNPLLTQRAGLKTATEEAANTLTREGVERPILVEGTCGFHARALGGAALPLLSQFAADHQSLMKAPA
jgi:hypothetical protein